MKKAICVVIIVAIASGVCACSNKTVESEVETTDIVTQYTTDNTVQTSISEESQTSLSEDHIYSLEGMSADEIVKDIYSFADIHTGDSLNDYPDRFSVSPKKREGAIGETFSFFAHDGIPNCIRWISIQTQIEMDNTITITNEGFVNVDLQLNDYEIAAEVYDKIYSKLSSINDWQVCETSDIREGAHWEYRLYCEVDGTEDDHDQEYSYFTTNYEPTGYYSHPQPSIVMDKVMTSDGDLYILSINLPIKYL